MVFIALKVPYNRTPIFNSALFQRTDLCRITAELLTQSADLPTSNMFCKSILHCGSFSIAKIVWDTICIDDTVNSLWVHVMANGLSEIN